MLQTSLNLYNHPASWYDAPIPYFAEEEIGLAVSIILLKKHIANKQQSQVLTSKPVALIPSPPRSSGSKRTCTNISLTPQDPWPSKKDKIIIGKLCFLNRKGGPRLIYKILND